MVLQFKEGDDEDEDFDEDSIPFEEVVGVVQPILRMLQVFILLLLFYKKKTKNKNLSASL
mgnify:CR=1 FL=1